MDSSHVSGSPQSQETAFIAWQNFTQGLPVDDTAVPPHILRGWHLSRECGVDPQRKVDPPVLSPAELEKLRRENSILLQAAEPMLNMLAVSIRDTGYIATFSVPSGHLLAVVGDAELMEQARDNYNIPGADRSIKAVGASALMLAILEKRPIMVQRFEHYNRHMHHWRCAAAPIFAFDDTPVASLTISSHISRKDIHTLTLAKSCAEGISIRMREMALLDTEKRLNALLETVNNSLPELVVAVGHDGLITHANDRALKYLGIAGGEPTHVGALFGKPDLARVERLLCGREPGTMEMEVLSRKGPQNLVCRFTPIILENGEQGGMTISINKRQQLLDLTRRVSGNYAKYSFEDIKGESACLKERINLAMRAAASNHRILLSGESGTGKELFAQSIHNASPSHNGPFVALSCAAIPRDLIESELFGYVGGAFTGARRDGMIGKMELATGGTLFLDEVNSLPLEMQAKLLRVLQQMEIVRLGDTKPTPINARIIAATNKDLREAVREGLFREDLYFRLNVVEIEIPPLRERRDDISLLVHIFLRRQSQETGRPFKNISGKALDALYSYHWPGNVRELDNICERALLLSENGIIDLKHLPAQLAGARERPIASPAAVALGASSMEDAARQAILAAIERHAGNMSKAAQQLGVARSTLYRKMRALGIEA